MKKNRMKFLMELSFFVLLALYFCVEDFYSERAGKGCGDSSGVR